MKKSRKPYVQEKKGRLYYRLTWHEGGKRRERFIPLPGAEDSAEFDRAYWSIRSGTAEAVKPPQKDTWADLITAYRAHQKFRKLAPRTRKSYGDILDMILDANAKNAVRATTRAHVRAIHQKYAATPRKADWIIQVLSILFNFARRTLDWQIDNPAEGIELYGAQREFEPWPDWMVAKAAEAPEMVRSAVELILGTGQRPTAAVMMRRDQINGEWMRVVDEKADQELEVYCPASLRAYVDELPIRGAHLIPKNLAQPVGYSNVEKAFRKWREGLGEKARPYSLHGLRKLSIIRLAEAGLTDAQIQAITNQSVEMVAFYRRRANRKRLSKSGQMLAEQNGGGT
jgi:hypothetical protein